MFAHLLPDDKDFKKTKKVNWIANSPQALYSLVLVEYDHIITKKKIEEADNVKDLVNEKSRIEYAAWGEGALRNLKQGTHLQLERRGFFYVDKQHFEGRNQVVLNFVPDGKTKSMSVVSSKVDAKEMAKGKGAAAESANKKEGGEENEGGEKKLSKKELKKLEKKEKKKASKNEGQPQS